MDSLIRHVYGDDCSVLIEQFGLIPTFNRALAKFTSEYAASLASQNTAPAVEKKPVTRDVEVSKATPEAEPAPVLDLTPPKPVSDNRVANDPRERRRLAKLAAEQAHEQAKQAHIEADKAQQAEEATPVVEEAVTAPVAEVVVEAVETVEPAVEAPIETTTESVEETVSEVAQATETTEEQSAEDSATSTKDKPARPRRPRGRPPKKVDTTPES